MIINKTLSEEILNDAGELKKTKAKRYVTEGRIQIIKSDYINPDNFCIKSMVRGNYDDYEVNIDCKNSELQVLECTCKDFERNYTACKHIIATLLKFEQIKYWEQEDSDIDEIVKIKNNNRFKYKNFNNLINSFYNDEIMEINENSELQDKVKIEVKANYDKFQSRIKFRI